MTWEPTPETRYLYLYKVRQELLQRLWRDLDNYVIQRALQPPPVSSMTNLADWEEEHLSMNESDIPSPTYHVTPKYWRDAHAPWHNGWELSITGPDVEGMTQCRHLGEAEQIAREYITSALDVEYHTELQIIVKLPDPHQSITLKDRVCETFDVLSQKVDHTAFPPHVGSALGGFLVGVWWRGRRAKKNKDKIKE